MASVTQWSQDSDSLTDPSMSAGAEPARLGEMVARSVVMQRLFSRLRQAAPHLRVVAIEGEEGTGKTLAAKTLHSLGPASAAAFVACTAARFLSAETQSLLEEARGGALLVDHLSDLTSDQQSRLSDFLQWWEQRSGRDGNTFLPRQVFVSSSKPLRQMSADGELRADLSYRLTAIRFELPPLRDRREDIGVLANWFATRHGTVHGKAVRGWGPGHWRVCSPTTGPAMCASLRPSSPTRRWIVPGSGFARLIFRRCSTRSRRSRRWPALQPARMIPTSTA